MAFGNAAEIKQSRNAGTSACRNSLTPAIKLLDETAVFDLLEKMIVDKIARVGAGGLGIFGERQHRFDVIIGDVRHARKNPAKGLVGLVKDRVVMSYQITRQRALAGFRIFVGNLDRSDISAQI